MEMTKQIPGWPFLLVQIRQACAFDNDPSHVYDFFLEHLQLKPIQTQFSSNSLDETMETNAIKTFISIYCFLFEKCAREAASLGASGHPDKVLLSCRGGLLVKAVSGRDFFWKMDDKWY